MSDAYVQEVAAIVRYRTADILLRIPTFRIQQRLRSHEFDHHFLHCNNSPFVNKGKHVRKPFIVTHKAFSGPVAPMPPPADPGCHTDVEAFVRQSELFDHTVEKVRIPVDNKEVPNDAVRLRQSSAESLLCSNRVFDPGWMQERSKWICSLRLL